MSGPLEAQLRALAPQVLAALVRRYRHFSECEDALQEALVAAARQWPIEGLPQRPRSWLIRVASRRLTDQVRADAARRHRETLAVSLVPFDEQIARAADEATPEHDDTLELFFLSCHPALSVASQIALTLRAVGGLTTAEIARAFLVPEATMAQRLSRAKASLRKQSAPFAALPEHAARERLPAVLRVLYLIFTEGYAVSSGPGVSRVDLSDEAIRVTRLLGEVAGDEPEVLGLLALMLLTDARRAARTSPSGELVPLDAQDRSRWDRARIAEGEALLPRALPGGGPYAIQAAIAALHDEAASTEATDWPQILALYDRLVAVDPSPAVRLSRVVALAMVHGPASGLRELDGLEATGHRHDAVRGHLLERLGDRQGAIVHLRRAAAATASTAEQRHLLLRAAALADG